MTAGLRAQIRRAVLVEEARRYQCFQYVSACRGRRVPEPAGLQEGQAKTRHLEILRLDASWQERIDHGPGRGKNLARLRQAETGANQRSA